VECFGVQNSAYNLQTREYLFYDGYKAWLIALASSTVLVVVVMVWIAQKHRNVEYFCIMFYLHVANK